MKSSALFVTALSLLVIACVQNEVRAGRVLSHTAYGYMERIGIPEAKRVFRKEKEESMYLMPRIVGGEVADIHQFNYQAGLLVTLENRTDLIGLCGGSLISEKVVVTAAHCWFDGVFHGTCMTVVLGSAKVFSGGLRIETCKVYMYPDWDPALAKDDVAVVYLLEHVTYSDTIAPIALPSKSDIHKDFVGEIAVASGFGRIDNNIQVSQDQVLSKVYLTVISNEECLLAYPKIILPSIICTSGNGTTGNVAICSGDSGGPLVFTKKGISILIGISSFGHPTGCNSYYPSGFCRVTSYLDFIKEHIKS